MPVILLAEVLEGGVAPGEDPWRSKAPSARLKVIEAFRGIPNGIQEIDINLYFMPGMCSTNPYSRGEQVLVFADFDGSDHVLRDNGCTQSVSGASIAEELETVRSHFRGAMKTEIYGRVAPNTDAESVNYVLSAGRTFPLAGVTVTAESQGKKYQAVSDANGKYSITGLPGGTFKVRTELSGFDNRGHEATVQVKEGNCAVQDFGLWTKNSVEGFVYDRNSSPVRGLHVFLSRTGAKEKSGKQATTNILGAFRFTEIDPGEYSVVGSPSGETADSPYTRTATVTPIQVGPMSTIEAVTLTVPPPIPTRNIRIHITRADGTPLTEGYLTCAQAGKEGEGYPMSQGLSPKAGGTICRALSDRIYRIRLERATTRVTPALSSAPEALVFPGQEDIDINLKIR